MNESLLNGHKFFGLFSIQFLNAMNDNLLKNAVLVMLAFEGIELSGISSGVAINLSTMLFILPFFLFASYAGKLADNMNWTLALFIYLSKIYYGLQYSR